MDVADWLRGLGLGQYEAAFHENSVTVDLLPNLTLEDLRDLGITAVGHRRRLLDAVAALRADRDLASDASSDLQTAGPAHDDRHRPPQSAAERRRISVMFCDVVGFTTLSSHLDPEDLSEVIRSYQACVARTIARFDGFIARYVGDGVLIYFGWPEARETDAERAVRAALAVIAEVGHASIKSEKLRLRIGIATGLVVIGEPIGTGEARQQTAIGETPNLAARLQSLASADGVVIDAATRRQIGGLFDLEDLGPQQLAGFVELQPAWRVLGESGEVSRFEALRSGETPLVGRKEEVELLVRRWQQAKTGEGRVVLISGEPGIGKSRLTAALSEHIGTEPHARLRLFSSPHYQDSALYPFIVQLERAAGFARDDMVEAKLGKLRALSRPSARDDKDIALLSELLSLPSFAADLNLSPQRKREELFEALLCQLDAEARHRPVLVVFEDAHWIDPTSRELLDLIVDRVRRRRVLLVITFRPEFQPPWGGRSHVTSLTLTRLGERDGEALVQKLAGTAALTPEIVAEIVQRTDGVPLFVEELTKAVLESAERGERVGAVLSTTSLTTLSVPATLHASLMARLDRLGPIAKEVAQIGAVIGREFGYDLLEPVARRPTTELRAALDRLAAAGLLFCRGVAPQSSYLFKHALVQDAAYGTLLRARRQELHSRVAAVLEQHLADLVERQPELLAHHLTAAGEAERAVDQWLKAGQYAAARLAHLEAIRHFDRGLATLAVLQEGPARDGRETELQLARGLSLFTAKGFISAEAAEAYARARELAERRGVTHQLFMAVFGLWQSTNSAGRVLDCRGLSDRLQRLTADNPDSELRLQAHHSAWTTHLFAGRPAAAREHCDEGRRLYNPEQHQHHRLLYGGHDPGVCAGYIGAQVNWLLGYPERGLAIGNEALVLAGRIAHPFSLESAQVFNAMLHLDRGEPELALQGLHAAEALAAEQRLGLIIAPGFLRGAALMAQGAFDDAVAQLREGLAGRLGAMFAPYGRARLAEALTRQIKHEAALATVKEALEEQERTGQRRWEPELHRVEGAALQGLNRLEEAQSALEVALRIARSQQAKSYELRAATSLARLWGEQGRRAAARDLLAPVYGWFTEGFDTVDLKEAKALIDELA